MNRHAALGLVALGGVLVCLATAATAAEPPPEVVDPLAFQVAPSAAPAAPPWGLKVVASAEQRHSRQAGSWPDGTVGQLALDGRHEWQLAPSWRLAVSDRLELESRPGGVSDSRNALREAFVSMEPAQGWYIDAGRINLRQGVAQGWNPTDWLRDAAVGAAYQSPGSARENRLGAVMLRLQHSQALGSAEIAWLPQLRTRRQAALSDWGLNLDRGNDAQALALRLAPQISQALSLDLNALARAGQRPGWSINATAVLGPRWLALLEAQWQVRSRLSGPGTASTAPASAQRALRLAAGLSLTLDSGAVLGLEWHRADDALGRADWRAWRSAAAASAAGARALGQLRSARAQRLDPLVRDALYLRGQCNDLSGDGSLDLGGLLRLNPYDHSRWLQLEGAWHLRPDWSLRLTLAATHGDALSEHGARALRRVLVLASEWHL